MNNLAFDVKLVQTEGIQDHEFDQTTKLVHWIVKVQIDMLLVKSRA